MKSELKTYQLEEIALNICDGVHNTVIDDENGDCLLLSAKNIQNGRIIFDDTDRKINRELCDKLKKRTHLSKNDIAITTVGANVGDLAIIGDGSENYEFQRSVGLIKTNTAIADSIYLFYLLGTKSFNYFFHVIATGSAQPCLFLGTLNKIKVTLPALSKQKRIASILSAYDNLIENNNKRIKILEQMAENLYKEWFVRFRFPGHETTPLENGIPKGWKKAKISDLCKFLNGFAFKSEEYCDDGQYRVVTIKNVQDGKFDLDSVEYINTIPPRMPSYCKLSIGDILMSLTGNVGRICYVTTNNCLLNQRVCKIKSEYPWFTYSFFKQDSIFQTLCNIAYGTAQLNLSPVLAGKMKIILPSGTLQKEYEKKVSPIFSHQQSLIEQNQILIKQRDLLLPRLMSGKLAV